MNKSHQTFKQCVSLSRVKSLAKNNFRASITGRKWACESLQIHQQVWRSYWDTKVETSSPKPKRWIFGPLFGSGDFRGANKHADFRIAGQHRGIFTGGFVFFWRAQINLRGFHIAREKLFCIASDLGVCDSNHIAHRGGIARFGPLSTLAGTH